MNATDLLVRPPRLASWLVELFASRHESDGILGDLEEDFRSAMATEGEPGARRRYWRQARHTIRDLAVAPWRRLIPVGIAGLAIGWPILWSLNAGARAIVVTLPVYSYVPASLFWTIVSLFGPAVAGCFIALVARLTRLRPMSVVVSMIAVVAIVFALDRPIMLWLYGPPRGVTFTFLDTFTRWAVGVAMLGGSLLVGGAIGQKLPLPRRPVRRAA